MHRYYLKNYLKVLATFYSGFVCTLTYQQKLLKVKSMLYSTIFNQFTTTMH